MKWFRFYSEFRHDTKMKRMPVQHRYAFIVLLCLANDSDVRGLITGLDDEDLAFELEMELEDWKTLKAKFRVKGLIDFNPDGAIAITNWQKRQFASDSSAERVAKHRAEKKKRECNVTEVLLKHRVTPSDTDTDTNSDPDPDPDTKNNDPNPLSGASAPRGGVALQEKKRTGKRKKMTAEQAYKNLPEIEAFNGFWSFYQELCQKWAANPGDKVSAAVAWREVMESGHSLDEVRKGAALFRKRVMAANGKGGIPHACRFLLGNTTDHPTPYWQAALEQAETPQQPAVDFVPDQTGEKGFYCSPLEQWAQYENTAEPIDMGGQLAAIKVYWRSQGLTWGDERLVQWFERSGIEYDPKTASLHRLADLAVCKLAHDLQKTFGGGAL